MGLAKDWAEGLGLVRDWEAVRGGVEEAGRAMDLGRGEARDSAGDWEEGLAEGRDLVPDWEQVRAKEVARVMGLVGVEALGSELGMAMVPALDLAMGVVVVPVGALVTVGEMAVARVVVQVLVGD